MNGSKSLQLCFGTHCAFSTGLSTCEYETQYEILYKPMISFLYNQPNFPFTLSFSGLFIEWIEQNHPEFNSIIEEILSRKQIDIIGGGYYAPLFPLLPPPDRLGQIELLTTTIRRLFSKRPRGAYLPLSAWEPSLLTSLSSCGIEFIFLDKTMIATCGYPNIDGFSPITIEDCGKTITALPLETKYSDIEKNTPQEFYKKICASLPESKESILVVFINPSSLPSFFSSVNQDNNWLQQFLSQLDPLKPLIEITTPSRYLKVHSFFSKAYICPGVSPSIVEKQLPMLPLAVQARTSVKQLISLSQPSINLYAKMMYVHSLVNQLRGDKSRKKNTREELWKSQCGEAFIQIDDSCTSSSAASRKLRLKAYKNLLLAEKATRLRGVFTPSIVSFDFDMDGIKEYVCQLHTLNAYVHQCGGKIFELDIFSANRNFADICIPSPGLFIDHLYTREDILTVKKGTLPKSLPVFSQTLYQDISFDTVKHEISLKAISSYGSLQQPVSLKKEYSFRDEGIQVQYILKNESPLQLTAVFAIEVDIALAAIPQSSSITSIFSNNTKQDCPVSLSNYSDVSWLMIYDREANIRFTFEANENPSATIIPIECSSCEINPIEHILDGTRVFLYWNVDLGPNFETEKMVFLKADL